MKKLSRATFLVLFTIGLGGCALPEKTQVRAPLPVQSTMRQAPPVYVQQSSAAKSLQQPSFVDLDDQQEEILVEDIESNLPSMVYINDRIFEYGRKLEHWKELDRQSVSLEVDDEDAAQMVRCFRRLQNVLNGYSLFRNKMLQAEKMATVALLDGKDVFELQKNDIAFLENACGRLLTDPEDQSVGWDQREEGADLSQLETLIDRYANSGEYEEVIQVWLQIPEFQIGRVHLRTKILYGNSLMFLHQEKKAAEIFQQVVDQMSSSDEQATDLVSLRKILADLYTASGDFKAARLQYEKISGDYLKLGQLEEWSKLQLTILDKSLEDSPELTEYASMLKNYLGFIPAQDGYKVVWQAEKFLTNYPYSPVAANVDFIKDVVTKKADKWFDAFIADIDALSAEKKFEDALELLETIPIDIISADKQMSVRDKNEELLLAEAVEKETEKMALMQELQHQWNNGLLLEKAGRYDEAIMVFSNLFDTEYSKKAEEKIQEVSLEAAKAARKKAANLFIRFTKTTDLESRKKLLIESRKLLSDILINYPEVEIVAKVRGNIERVEQEMNSIDPGLIAFADQEPDNSQPVDGVDSVFSLPLQQQTVPQDTNGLNSSVEDTVQ